MAQHLSAVTLLVPDYDLALDFYVGALGFDLVEDKTLGDGKRWVLVAPPGSRETRFLLARAKRPAERSTIGDQAGGSVFLFLATDDFVADHARLATAGVRFAEPPRHESYGTVAVFTDPFGNRWDLIEPATDDPFAAFAEWSSPEDEAAYGDL
jgi:catechol 2,3-dioxygenase-like lactoylglutathione lyase family enzyme